MVSGKLYIFMNKVMIKVENVLKVCQLCVVCGLKKLKVNMMKMVELMMVSIYRLQVGVLWVMMGFFYDCCQGCDVSCDVYVCDV